MTGEMGRFEVIVESLFISPFFLQASHSERDFRRLALRFVRVISGLRIDRAHEPRTQGGSSRSASSRT
jgi:hypothetical protein